MSATADDLGGMLLGRFLVGTAMGFSPPVAALYITEVSPVFVRGTYGSFTQIATCLGLISSFFIGIPAKDVSRWWRVCFWVSTVPASLLALLMEFCAESPHWLFKRGRSAKAKAEFAKLLGGLHVKSSMVELSKSDRGDEVDGVKLSEMLYGRHFKVDWLKKSETGSKNRKSGDSNGTSSRHTGGSMGYAERRARMKRKMNEEPNFKQLFLETHLTKECKKKLRDDDIGIYNLKELMFCTERAKKAYGDYLDAMHDVYREDFKEYPDDPEVWARVHAEGRTHRVYGVGSSDLEYLVTGASSSSVGSAPSHANYQ